VVLLDLTAWRRRPTSAARRGKEGRDSAARPPALAVRLAWTLGHDRQLAWPDEYEFVAIGRALAHGDGYVSSSYRNAPVLPAYLGLVFRAFGEDYMAARVGQAVLGAITCVLVYATGTLLASPAAGVLSGAMLALYPPQVYLAGVFYTSCFETFFCALAVYLGARVAVSIGGVATAALAGIAVGLTVLTRPVFVVLGPSILVSWLWAAGRAWRRVLWPGVALVASAACTILPWTLRNQTVYGRFLLVSSGGGVTLWKGNNELADGGPDDRYLKIGLPPWVDRLAMLDEPTQRQLRGKYEPLLERIAAREREVGDRFLALDDVLGPVGRAYIAEAPGRALGRFAIRITTFFSAFSRTLTSTLPGTAEIVAAISFYPLLLLALLGVPLALPRAPGLLLPLLLVVSFTGMHAVLTACTRYRLPIDPYIILFAACTLVEIVRRTRPRAVRTD
jgi:4-amino-4-deoxy-L-arabinose transferase-like glycosyltransferase